MKLPEFIRQRLLDRCYRVAMTRRPDVVIGGTDQPYMLRWHLIKRNRLFNIYLHHFKRSDEDRALHDHPWLNCSLLLHGSYFEHTIAEGGIETSKKYEVGSIKFRRAASPHRIELVHGQDSVGSYDLPCITLFITGPKIRDWGFHCAKAGWRRWQDFCAPHDEGQTGRGCD